MARPPTGTRYEPRTRRRGVGTPELRLAERRLEQEVRRKAREQAVAEREQARRASAADAERASAPSPCPQPSRGLARRT